MSRVYIKLPHFRTGKKTMEIWMNQIDNISAKKSDSREFGVKLEESIKSFESTLGRQLKDLDAKIEQTSFKIIIQLGALMTVLMTIMVVVLLMIIK